MSLGFTPILSSYRWPLFVLLFASFFSAIVGDSTAEALLLARFGSGVVPGLFVVNAVLLFLVSVFVMSVIDRMDRGLLFGVFICTHAIILLVVRVAVALRIEVVYAPLFSYAYVTKILLFLLFWTLANDLVDSRKAQAEFPLIAAGGTLGAIAISFGIPRILTIISAENLLLVWAGATLITGALFLPVHQSYRNYFRPTIDRGLEVRHKLRLLSRDLMLVRTEPLLSSMALFYFLLFFIIFNQHFAFYSVLKKHFAQAQNQASELASFLGYFNGISMGSTFLLQMTVSGRILKNAGSTRALFILPTVLLIVFAVLGWYSFLPGMQSEQMLFWAVIAGVGIRIAFFDSFFSPNFQIFFSSLPQSVRGRGKLSIEGVVKPLAMIAASCWLGFVVPRIPFSLHMLSLFAVAVVMVHQTSRFRKTYAESLSRYLRGFKSRHTEWLRTLYPLSKEVLLLDLPLEMIAPDKKITGNLGFAAYLHSPAGRARLLELMASAEGRTRATIISALAGAADAALRSALLDRLDHDEDERVLANAIEALSVFNDSECVQVLQRFRHHRSNRIRANTAIALYRWGNESVRKEIVSALMTMTGSEDAGLCAASLYAFGEIGYTDLVTHLGRMYGERQKLVLSNRMVWRQMIGALSKSSDPRALDLLLAMSDSAGQKQRNDLSNALGLLMSRGFDTENLLYRITGVNYIKRAIILKAIYRKGLPLSKSLRRSLHETALSELRDIYADWASVHTLSRNAENCSAVWNVLQYAIREECIGGRLRNLLFMGAVLDDRGQLRSIIHRFQHTNRYVRARAFEVLDNCGDFRINRAVLRLLESSEPDVHMHEASTHFGISAPEPEAILYAYARNPSSWVRQCVAFARQEMRGALV